MIKSNFLMKSAVALVLCALLVTSCGSDDKGSISVSLNPTAIDNVAADGGEQTVTLSSPTDWTVKTPDWISVSPQSGAAGENQSVKVTVAALPYGQARTGVVTVTADGKDYSIDVAQKCRKVKTLKQWFTADQSVDYIVEYDDQNRILRFGRNETDQSRGDQTWHISYGEGTVTVKQDNYSKEAGGNLYEYTFTLENGVVKTMAGKTNYRHPGGAEAWSTVNTATATYSDNKLTKWEETETQGDSRYTETFTFTWSGNDCVSMKTQTGSFTIEKAYTKSTVANNLNLDMAAFMQDVKAVDFARMFGFAGVYTAMIPGNESVDTDVLQEYTVTKSGTSVRRIGENGDGFELTYE